MWCRGGGVTEGLLEKLFLPPPPPVPTLLAAAATVALVAEVVPAT